MANPALAPETLGLIAASLGTVASIGLTLSLRRIALKECLGPMGSSLTAPWAERGLILARWGLIACAVTALVALGIVSLRPDQAPAVIAGFVGGGLLGHGAAWLVPVSEAQDKANQSRRPTTLAPSMSMGLMFLIFSSLSLLLHRQGLPDQASLACGLALGLLVLASIQSPARVIALLAARPAPLIQILAPLALGPLVLVSLASSLLWVATGLQLLTALGGGIALGVTSALVRLLIALCRLGHSQAMAPRFAALELLMPAFLVAMGQWPLVPLWLVFRIVWLWRRALRVRFNEITL